MEGITPKPRTRLEWQSRVANLRFIIADALEQLNALLREGPPEEKKEPK